MGSTIETAIVFSIVFTVICMFIVFPLDLCGEAYSSYCLSCEDIDDFYSDKYNSQDFNFMLTGLSENYRLIYEAMGD